MVNLFKNEEIISQSSDNQVVLTTHRICIAQRGWGLVYNHHIMLEHITSTEVIVKSYPILLILSICSVIAAFALFQTDEAALPIAGFTLAGILFYLFRRTKKGRIIISSPSSKMIIYLDGMEPDQAIDFINKVEFAKVRLK